MIISNKSPLELNSKFILVLAMLYTTVILAADVVAFRFDNFFGLIESGATIIFPLSYIIGDVTCEVYGWNISMKIVWFGLLCEAVFSLLIMLVIFISPAGPGEYQSEYNHVLGNIPLFVVAGIISNAVAGLLNVYFISKWKLLMSGKAFWLRSIIATCISELILILITGLIAFVPILKIELTMDIIYNAYILELIYAFIFVIPAYFIVNLLKKYEGIDAYDYGVSYNPFNFINKKEG